MVDKDRKFLLQLSLALHVPVFELEQYPHSIINEYKALNIVSPFTNDAIAVRDGILLSLVRNQNVSKKKDLKSAEDILPYLKEYPDYLEHPSIKKVDSVMSMCTTNEQVQELLKSVSEEIEIESNKADPDSYVISRLTEFYLKNIKDA